MIINGSASFWLGTYKGVEDIAKELNVKASVGSPTPAEHAKQVSIFRDAIAAKVAGIAISPIQADAMKTEIDSAIAAGVNVITFDSDSSASKRPCYLGTDNIAAGKALGEEAKKLLPNGGKLVAFVGNMGAQNAKERYQGFKEAIAGTKLEFIQEPFEDNKDQARAKKNAQDALLKYKGQLVGLVALYGYNSPANVSALKEAGLIGKIKVISFDGDPATLKSLTNGEVDVTVVQKPYQFGRLTVMLLNALHKSKGDLAAAIKEIQPELDKQGMKVKNNGSIIDTGVDVLTPANCKPFLDKLKEQGLEST